MSQMQQPKVNCDSMENTTIPEYLGSPSSTTKLHLLSPPPPTTTSMNTTTNINQHSPSYLSLACTVNGYSTTTNYDPIRLSKSRDASPMRPIDEQQSPTHSSPPLNNSSVLTSKKKTSPNTSPSHSTPKKVQLSNGHLSKDEDTNNHDEQPTDTKTFIQQRIERLYGPGALMQGFFSTTKDRQKLSRSLPVDEVDHEKATSGLAAAANDIINLNISLPVLRHLRPEFRAQLHITSNPRKFTTDTTSSTKCHQLLPDLLTPTSKSSQTSQPSVNGQNENNEVKENGSYSVKGDGKLRESTVVTPLIFSSSDSEENETIKDGHYFLRILNTETERILKGADACERELVINGTELSEDAIGKVRSAAGKARLLVTQKMKQFQGLCNNNLNQATDEQFPTTSQDLQGFWDMILLQVDHVDSLLAEIDQLKRNNWVVSDRNDSQLKMTKSTKKLPISSNNNNYNAKRTGSDSQRQQRNIERKKLIEAHRKAMKARNTSTTNSEVVEIFVTKTS